MKSKPRRRGLGGFVLILALAWLAPACQFGDQAEDCEVAGDEDDNGLADCNDPLCSGVPACQPRCGNGIVTSGEACDDGNTTNGDGCDYNCKVTSCGNGIVTRGEACDDGNARNGDGCDYNCKVTGCGNGVVTPGEACDDGNTSDTDACTSACRLAWCGDGLVQAIVEQCDDRNTSNTDACTSACKLARCGDGFIQAGVEQCDDGNTRSTDACTHLCKPARCGDGVVQTGVEQCDDGNTTSGDGCDADCTVTRCGNGIVTAGEACDDGNTSNHDACTNACTLAWCGDGFVQIGVEQCDSGNTANVPGCDNTCTADVLAYVKASNTGASDTFGRSVALSADGSTLVIGAPQEDSAATGVDGTQSDNAAANAGAVYVFTRNGTVWSQQAYIKASNTGASDAFGRSVALSADGSILAVGAVGEASAATGIGGTQSDNAAVSAGAIYVFSRSGTTWSQQAYVKASNTGAGDLFGVSIALSGDGSILAVGASQEDSATTGIDSDQADNSALDAGAVYVFSRSGTTWSQQAYVKASSTGAGDLFGVSVALSGDGSTLAVGASQEDSAATGIGGEPSDNSAQDAGAVYVFSRSGTTWSQQAYAKASNTGAGDLFGVSVALSSDGSILAVGAEGEDSAAIGIGGNQANNSALYAGAIYVFTRSGTAWSPPVYVKASNTGPFDRFGVSVALSGDGSILAVGAKGEFGGATGIGGNQASNSSWNTGAVYVFTRSGTTWSPPAYVKASNTGGGDYFGEGVALSGDGATLAVGAWGEDSAATGIDGDQTNNSASSAGAVYVYH